MFISVYISLCLYIIFTFMCVYKYIYMCNYKYIYIIYCKWRPCTEVLFKQHWT